MRKLPLLALGGVASILVLAMVLLWLAAPGAATFADGERIGGPFSLIDDHGHAVTERSFPDKFLVVYFGYATCRDVCPATLSTLAASLDRLGRKADAVQPLFVTLDAAHDTPAVLHRYLGAFSARLVGLSGTDAQLRKIAGEYGVVRITRPDAKGGDTVLDHSSVLYVMAPGGGFVALIPADASEMVMTQAIGRYVS